MHGAFTWGVLDRLVEDGRFHNEGISGMSAGAINAVLFASGRQVVSPYQINPFDINPLCELLQQLVDFERLRAERSPRLLIVSTALRTGSLRLFTNRDLSPKAVLASACLPWLHQAVEIDGEPF